MNLAQALARTKQKLQRGEKLIIGEDLIINPEDAYFPFPDG